MNLSIKFSRIPARHLVTQFFVPKHEAARVEDIERVKEFLHDKPKILVLTGNYYFFNNKHSFE